MTTAHEYAKANADRFFEQYQTILSIPSISTQPEHAGDVQRAAEWLVEDMRRVGFEKVEAIKMPGGRHPLVLGEWNGAGDAAPTVLIYCHFDVQPAAMEDGWETNPFEPTIKDGKIFARGAVDSKLHVISQLKAVESLLASEGGSPVNIKLILEGEEESGSENIRSFVDQHGDRLKSDICLICDGSGPDIHQPMLDYGLRGITTMEFHVTGPVRDLHSGHFGGSVHNPIQALAEIIAQLHDDNGTVTVPGFYDDVLPLTDEEREDLKKALPWSETEWTEVTGAPQQWGESEYTVLERTGGRPTLEINGIAGGFYSTGFKTVLPSRALAKISCRLVPNQDPPRIGQLVKDYLMQLTPPTVHSEVRLLEMGAEAVRFDRKSVAMQAAAAAYEKGWGNKPYYSRAGGSVPIVDALQRLGADMALMSFGYKGNRAHGPNEYVIIEMFHRGVATAIHFLQEVASRAE